MVWDNWCPFNGIHGRSVANQFEHNLKNIKYLVKYWASEVHRREEEALLVVEQMIKAFSNSFTKGFWSQESHNEIHSLVAMRKVILVKNKMSWKVKSRELWLDSRDKNIKFFHTYAKGRKINKIIWRMVDEEDYEVSNLRVYSIRQTHFQNVFKELQGLNIDEIIHVA